jgi:hypothetical protein
VARRPLRSPTNCVVAPQASSLRPPPPASLRTWHRGRLPSLRGAVDLSPSRTDLGCSERSLPEAYAKHLITFGCSLLPSMVGRSSFHIGPFRARRTVADPLRVLRTSGGRPSHLIFRELHTSRHLSEYPEAVLLHVHRLRLALQLARLLPPQAPAKSIVAVIMTIKNSVLFFLVGWRGADDTRQP